MKKLFKMMVVFSLAVVVSLLFVKEEPVKAETMREQAENTVVFGEYDTLELKYNEFTTIEVVMKEKGSFVLDFSPKSFAFVAELYDEDGNRISRISTYGSSSMEFENIEAGTYYLRMWTWNSNYAGTKTYFARQIPSDSASISICISIKKGKSVQLASILNNCKDKTVKWSTSNKKIATVTSKGKVIGMKKGNAVIKLSNSGGLVAKINIKVTN